MISMTNNNIVNIHGKNYITVAGRVEMAHEKCKQITITTEVLPIPNQVVVKATVITEKGTFTGISAANPSKLIEKQSPYEVAETSAVGRALGFAGYGVVEGIATADEMKKAEVEEDDIDSILNDTINDEIPEKTIEAPYCQIHKCAMKERINKNGGKWYDHRREVNGVWEKCNGEGWKT
jgi:hypothetical protein